MVCSIDLAGLVVVVVVPATSNTYIWHVCSKNRWAPASPCKARVKTSMAVCILVEVEVVEVEQEVVVVVEEALDVEKDADGEAKVLLLVFR
jgi:hypothetical protein